MLTLQHNLTLDNDPFYNPKVQSLIHRKLINTDVE